MKFDKIEEKISKELNERLINPSENSWDRLDAMLTLVEEKTPKRQFRWIYIAASIVGILLMVTVYVNQNNKTIELENTVVTKQNSDQNSTKILEESKVKTDVKKLDNIYIASKKAQSNVKEEIENLSVKVDKTSFLNDEIIDKNKELFKTENNNLAEINVDNLIESASTNTLTAFKMATIKVNAKNLLNQVDEPVSLTFKDKALITIAENYINIQQSISNRNQ